LTLGVAFLVIGRLQLGVETIRRIWNHPLGLPLALLALPANELFAQPLCLCFLISNTLAQYFRLFILELLGLLPRAAFCPGGVAEKQIWCRRNHWADEK
jgi:hypothetical protein